VAEADSAHVCRCWHISGEFADCSINGQYLGKTYCFGSTEAMGEFMKNPKDNLAKAQTYYSSKHPG
jgi:YHS domain-containing protein